VAALITDPSRRSGTPSAQALLTSIGLCGVCGATVHGGRTRDRQRIYRCSATYGHFGRKADPVDEYVGAVVVERSRARRVRAAARSGDDRLHAVRMEAQAARARLRRARVDYADGVLTSSQMRTATERLRTRIGELERQLAELGRSTSSAAC
jgi:hypothetical protein